MKLSSLKLAGSSSVLFILALCDLQIRGRVGDGVLFLLELGFRGDFTFDALVLHRRFPRGIPASCARFGGGLVGGVLGLFLETVDFFLGFGDVLDDVESA